MKKLLLLLCMAITTMAFSQALKTVSGNLDFLKDQTEVNVAMKFDNVLIFVDNISEDQYPC